MNEIEKQILKNQLMIMKHLRIECTEEGEKTKELLNPTEPTLPDKTKGALGRKKVVKFDNAKDMNEYLKKKAKARETVILDEKSAHTQPGKTTGFQKLKQVAKRGL